MIWDYDYKIIKIMIDDVLKFYLYGKYYVIYKLIKKRKNFRNDMNIRCLLICVIEFVFLDKNLLICYIVLFMFRVECRF